jgi:hypothetical protein
MLLSARTAARILCRSGSAILEVAYTERGLSAANARFSYARRTRDVHPTTPEDRVSEQLENYDESLLAKVRFKRPKDKA